MDVETLAKQFADVEEAPLPVMADAITVGVKRAGVRPRMILNAHLRSPLRRRFTLAHEIGHIRIPWHVGTIVSHVEYDIRYTDEIYAAIESEANQFAGELLIPSVWLKQLARSHDDVGELVKTAARESEVSLEAAAIQCSRSLPPGFVFVVTTASGIVKYSGRSPNTGITLVQNGDRFDSTTYKDLTSNRAILPLSYRLLHVFQLPIPVLAPSTLAEDPRGANDVLREMLQGVPAQDAAHLRQSINGVVGAINKPGATLEEIVGRVFQRCTSDPKYGLVSSHPDFRLYANKKAHEILARRGG